MIAAGAPGEAPDPWAIPPRFSNRAIFVLISAAFVAPNLLLAARLQAAPAALVAAGCVGAILLMVLVPAPMRRGVLGSPIAWPRLVSCLVLASALLLLGGETHLFFANPDWWVRDAVLADLVKTPSLPAYLHGGIKYLLRAPLGMFMTPALVGAPFGLLAAHLALLAQNALILGGILYLFLEMSFGWRHLAVLVLFGGLNALARVLLVINGGRATVFSIARPWDEWHPFLQYTSSLTQFFWVPNHALPGWWVAALLLLGVDGEVDAAIIGVTIAALQIWSPLAILSAVPAALVIFAGRWRATLLSRRTWMGLAVAAAFVPFTVYLMLAAGSIAHGGAGQRPNSPAGQLIWYGLFIVIELAAAIFVALERRSLRHRLHGLFWISFAILLALPLFSFGPSNDLVMRASIASLVIVAFCLGDVLCGSARPRGLAAVVGWAIVAVGAAPAAVEVARALTTPAFPISNCSLTEAVGRRAPPPHYVVPADQAPVWLLPRPSTWLGETAPRSCWPTPGPPPGGVYPRAGPWPDPGAGPPPKGGREGLR